MKGHLVTCINISELHKFDTNRFVGLGPFYPTDTRTNRRITARLRILWDVIADLKRVQPGDICFLHSEGRIFGPYIFNTGFYESRRLPTILRSKNLSPDAWLKNRQKFSKIKTQGYGYVAAISKPIGCNDNGVNLMELFLRQSMGIFNGIPPRFMYGDTKKIVKPLLCHEVSQLLKMLSFKGKWGALKGRIFPIANLKSISLDLSDYDGHLFCEKILEAWFMENLESSSSGYNGIEKLIGKFTYYANSTYTYYTNFLDVLVYSLPHNFNLKQCKLCGNMVRDFASDIRLIELKRDRLSDNLSTIEQVQGYMKWAKSVLNPKAKVSGYIVAAGYNKEYISFAKSKSVKNIQLLQYKLKSGVLSLHKLK